MNLSGLGAGLGAVSGGYQQGQLANNQIEQGQLQNADAQAKQIGMAAYFRALQALTGGAQQQASQPPMPGQPSTPMAQPASMRAPQVMDRGGTAQPDQQGAFGRDAVMMPQAPAQGAPVMAQGGGPAGMPVNNSPPGGQQLTWQTIVQQVKQQNPGVDDMALARAVDNFMPMMAQQSKLEWQELKNQMRLEIANTRADAWRDTARTKADATVGAATTRGQTAATAEEGRQGRFAQSEDRRERAQQQRGEQFQQREQRLEKALGLRADTTWARLDQQKQALAERVRMGDKKQGLAEWRAILDAQHKRAMEIIQTSNVNNMMDPKAKQQMIKEQNDWYNGEIEKMRGTSSQRGNVTDETEIPGSQSTVDLPAAPARTASAQPGAQPASVAAAAPAASSTLPPAAMSALKEGVVTTFQNGQKWTLEAGQPKQVP